MSSIIFDIMNLLDSEKVHYVIQRTRLETLQINATFIGARIEIEIFADDHIEISRFIGNEDVESGGIEVIKEIVRTYL